ncbi:MAG: hypothetical protein HPM95_04445 [Alphaproteobacteria bacterium]|nr:hypothetical protein [Alphaproteobacteria bacterium]
MPWQRQPRLRARIEPDLRLLARRRLAGSRLERAVVFHRADVVARAVGAGLQRHQPLVDRGHHVLDAVHRFPRAPLGTGGRVEQPVEIAAQCIGHFTAGAAIGTDQRLQVAKAREPVFGGIELFGKRCDLVFDQR